MTSKYVDPQRYAVPEGFNYVLKDFCREVLREQVAGDAIYAFGARYFRERQARDASAAPADAAPGRAR